MTVNFDLQAIALQAPRRDLGKLVRMRERTSTHDPDLGEVCTWEVEDPWQAYLLTLPRKADSWLYDPEQAAWHTALARAQSSHQRAIREALADGTLTEERVRELGFRQDYPNLSGRRLTRAGVEAARERVAELWRALHETLPAMPLSEVPRGSVVEQDKHVWIVARRGPRAAYLQPAGLDGQAVGDTACRVPITEQVRPLPPEALRRASAYRRADARLLDLLYIFRGPLHGGPLGEVSPMAEVRTVVPASPPGVFAAFRYKGDDHTILLCRTYWWTYVVWTSDHTVPQFFDAASYLPLLLPDLERGRLRLLHAPRTPYHVWHLCMCNRCRGRVWSHSQGDWDSHLREVPNESVFTLPGLEY